MTDEELIRLLTNFHYAILDSLGQAPVQLDEDGEHRTVDAARAAILSHFDRRKEGEGGEDAARLDWMERNVGPTRSLDFRYSAIWDAVYINDYNESLPPKPDGGVRDAIDAARTEGKGNG